MRPNIPHFWKIMAQEMTENRRRIKRTARATHPVCWRMPGMSVAKITVSRKMMGTSVRARIFPGVRNVAYAPSTRNPYDARVSDSAAYEETGEKSATYGLRVLGAYRSEEHTSEL